MLTLSTLVLVNRKSPFYVEEHELILPYLDHFGVPYQRVDLAEEPFPADTSSYPLVIVAYALLTEREKTRLLDSARAGTGLVIFDPDFSGIEAADEKTTSHPKVKAEFIEITESDHWISAMHGAGEKIDLVNELLFQPVRASANSAILMAGGKPFVSTHTFEQGRIVQWATASWIHSQILGPLAGLDDIFWRSLVWAARKPYAFRGLPPLVTMRIDDVAGLGEQWSQSPLYWINIAHRLGFKLGLGLFLYNLSEMAVSELRKYIQKGITTALPEAFGRPPRNEETSSFYYSPDGLPLLGTKGDEFLYFHHHEHRPWTVKEAQLAMKAADDWYKGHAPLPKSCLIGPHWYEYSSSVAAHMFDHWGVEFLSTTMGVDEACQSFNPWLKIGPFRCYEEPGTALPSLNHRGSRPVYYADFLTIANRRFFNCITEIRDITGYEWRPDNHWAETTERGIRTVRRALDSMALAVLFTHETDYLRYIEPQNLEKELTGVHAGIAAYDPIYVTQDEGFRFVRATKTSHFRAGSFDPVNRTIQARFSGFADVPTSFHVFYDTRGKIQHKSVPIPAFHNETSVTFSLPQK